MTSSLPRLGADLLVGCVVVGAVLGVAAGSIIYILTRETDCLGRAFADLVLDASDRYLVSRNHGMGIRTCETGR